MQAKNRDLALDVLKGLGCLMMIMAHMPIKVGIYRQLTFLGDFAPVPFYAGVGVTAGFQAQKYKPRSVILTYLFLFLLGFALNGFNSPDFLRPPVIHFDIIQIIAIGSATVYLLEYYFKPPAWIYLILGILSFVIKLGLDVVLPARDYPLLAGLLLTYAGTFPIFPWLFLFFLGMFAYRIHPAWNLSGLAISILLYIVLALLGFNLNYRSKYDMSVGYFLLCCSLLFALFFLAPKLRFLQKESSFNPLIFFGQNSLLFLFVHFATIVELSLRLNWNEKIALFVHYPFLFWLLIMMVSWIVMIVLLYLAKFKWSEFLFDKLWIWILLVLMVLAVPLVPSNGFVRWAEVALGIVSALYYHQLSRILKQKQAPAAG